MRRSFGREVAAKAGRAAGRVAPKPYDAGGHLATAGGWKIRLARRSPHPGHIPSVCWTCGGCRVLPCDQSDTSPASPTLTADTPSISLSLSTSDLALEDDKGRQNQCEAEFSELKPTLADRFRKKHTQPCDAIRSDRPDCLRVNENVDPRHCAAEFLRDNRACFGRTCAPSSSLRLA